MHDHDPAALDRIAAYNEDDVRATRRCATGWSSTGPTELGWRDAELEPEEGCPELDEQVEQLHAFGPDTPEHLLGDVLGYWRRESAGPPRAPAGPMPGRSGRRCSTIPMCSPASPGSARSPRLGKTGKVLDGPAMQFTFPEQVTDGFGSQR